MRVPPPAATSGRSHRIGIEAQRDPARVERRRTDVNGSSYDTILGPNSTRWQNYARYSLFWLCAAIGCQRAPTDPKAQIQSNASTALTSKAAPSDAESSARKLCGALHAVSADRKAACCGGSPERVLLEECVRWVSASLSTGSVNVNATRVDGCRTAMQNAVAGCDWVTLAGTPSVAACEGLLEGKLAEGAACRSSLECRAPLHCDGAAGMSTGTCRPPRELGQGCGTLVDPLASYVLEHKLEVSRPLCRDFCSLLSHRCETTPQVGDACVASVNCARGQRCVAGHCSDAKARAAGESCVNAPCDAGLRCQNQHCVPLARAGCRAPLEALRGGTTPAMRLPLRPRRAD
jgi:hypothetical protein